MVGTFRGNWHSSSSAPSIVRLALFWKEERETDLQLVFTILHSLCYMLPLCWVENIKLDSFLSFKMEYQNDKLLSKCDPWTHGNPGDPFKQSEKSKLFSSCYLGAICLFHYVDVYIEDAKQFGAKLLVP